MRLCRFGRNRLGVYDPANDMVADVSAALDLLPALRYPLPGHDLLIANLTRVKAEARRLLGGAKKIPVQLDVERGLICARTADLAACAKARVKPSCLNRAFVFTVVAVDLLGLDKLQRLAGSHARPAGTRCATTWRGFIGRRGNCHQRG